MEKKISLILLLLLESSLSFSQSSTNLAQPKRKFPNYGPFTEIFAQKIRRKEISAAQPPSPLLAFRQHTSVELTPNLVDQGLSGSENDTGSDTQSSLGDTISNPSFPAIHLHSLSPSTTDVLSAAVFLIQLARNEQKEETLTISKLHQLLYYAQGYSMALYGTKLCDTPFIHAASGPTAQRLSQFTTIDSLIEAQQATQFTVSQKEVLETVYALKGGLDDFKFSQDLHVEVPYLNSSLNENLSDTDMTKYFREVSPWADYMIQRLILVADATELSRTLDAMRGYLSFWCQEADIIAIHTKLLEKCGEIETRMRFIHRAENVSYRYCKWPHQKSYFQGLMGHLFFPVPLELGNDETTGVICMREKVQTLLAFSAKYDNPLAHYYLNEIFRGFYEFLNPQGELDDPQNFLPHVKKELITNCLDSTADRCPPLFFSALLCSITDNQTDEYTFLKKGFDQGDILAVYRFTELCTVKGDLPGAMAKLETIHPGYASFLKARSFKEELDRITQYELAGSQGVAHGYLIAGDLCKSRPDSQERALKNYLLAAQHHILSAYDACAALYLEKGLLEKAFEMYICKGRTGAPVGYCQAGELIKDKDTVKASQLFDAAGLEGYSPKKKLMRYRGQSIDYDSLHRESIRIKLASLIRQAEYTYE